jgi:methylated-DNA-[protein]-cysteine S-methyltransferase
VRDSIYVSQFDSPIGRIWGACRGGKILKIAMSAETDQDFFDWLRKHFPETEVNTREVKLITTLFTQLSGYFERRVKNFDLAMEFCGTTFQKRVWTELLKISYGQLVTYGELARRLNMPQASRAIGSANGVNPLPIVVPCHRIVGHNGKLVGYGNGLSTKAFLLRLEAGQEALPFDLGLSSKESKDKDTLQG